MGAAATTLSDSDKSSLLRSVSDIYEAKHGQVEDKELLSEMKTSVNGFLKVLDQGDDDGEVAEPKEVRTLFFLSFRSRNMCW